MKNRLTCIPVAISVLLLCGIAGCAPTIRTPVDSAGEPPISHDAAKANEFLNADRCIPIHYNTWDIIKADAKAFGFKIEKQGKKCTVLNPGEFFKL